MYEKIDIHKNVLYKIIKNKFYFDKLYTQYIAERFILPLSHIFGTGDKGLDKGIDDFGGELSDLGGKLRKIETGYMTYYVVFLVVGISVIFLVIELLGMIN